MKRLIILIPFLLFTILHFTNAQDSLFQGGISIAQTFHNIGIQFDFKGDDNLNSTMELIYRKVGDEDFKKGSMSIRAHEGILVDGQNLDRNYHAASAMHLEDDQFYELVVNIMDPDGGTTTQSVTLSTRKIPEPVMENIRYVTGNGGGSGTESDPFLGLNAASNAAQRGDHFIVAPGIYSPFEISTSEVSFKSQELHGAIIDGANTDRGIITLGSFDRSIGSIFIDGFIIQNGNWAIDAQNTRWITVRNNIIQDVDNGYVNRREEGLEEYQYITNNVFKGRTAWPNSGIPGERGIDIRGRFNVISCNTIENFGDGISTDGPPYEKSIALDIHNNDIKNIVDDHIEVDGMISNTRIYNNRCFNARAGISVAPVFGGPVYIFRN
ncbi:MAG: hypothetical protein AAGK97_12400 [Bacteroidota bacterium]